MKKLFLSLLIILMAAPANIVVAGSTSELQKQPPALQIFKSVPETLSINGVSQPNSQTVITPKPCFSLLLINGCSLQNPPIEYFENKAYIPLGYIKDKIDEQFRFEYGKDFFKISPCDTENSDFTEFTYKLTDDLEEAENNAALIYNDIFYFPIRHLMNYLGYETTYYTPENFRQKIGQNSQYPSGKYPVITLDKTKPAEAISQEEDSDDSSDTAIPLFRPFSEDLFVNNDFKGREGNWGQVCCNPQNLLQNCTTF